MPSLEFARQAMASCWQALLDVVYPRTCRMCDKPLPERVPLRPLAEWFCQGCEDTFTRLEAPYCSVCAEPYEGMMEGPFRCGNCADRKLAFEFAVAGYHAEGAVRELVHRFKYGRDISLRGALGDLLLAALQDPRLREEDFSAWRLVPVPLHGAREREREFNQSLELCRRLARQTGIAVTDAMRRQRPTNKQSRLTRAQRLENLKGAFGMKRRFRGAGSSLRGLNVLLVDDVFTTGATTDACARVLRREGGVQKVVVIAVARG
ncbi:MAG: competence protein ComF [Verrucomicrobiaceae bacterium]|nr:competence protein ComF [Verrucomicrobiaceae bacterium]